MERGGEKKGKCERREEEGVRERGKRRGREGKEKGKRVKKSGKGKRKKEEVGKR